MIKLLVNGCEHSVPDVPDAPLLAVLRNDLGCNGPKYSCGLGECGACTVLIDGQAARACTIPLHGVAGRAVTTLEGLGQPGAWHPVQQAFIDTQAAQCGYCLNGMVMATVALLRRQPKPTDAQARAALQHNLCRCGTHLEILQAVHRAAALMAAADDATDTEAPDTEASVTEAAATGTPLAVADPAVGGGPVAR